MNVLVRGFVFIVCLGLGLVFMGCELGVESFGKSSENGSSELRFVNNLSNDYYSPELNVSLRESLVLALTSLAQLNRELDNLSRSIEEVNGNIGNLSLNENLTPETVEYLNEVEELTKKSKAFVAILKNSTRLWEEYLTFGENRTRNVSLRELGESFVSPVTAFNSNVSTNLSNVSLEDLDGIIDENLNISGGDSR